MSDISVTGLPPHIDAAAIEEEARAFNAGPSDGKTIAELMEVYGIAPPWSSQQLDDAEIETTYLAHGVLVQGQPGIIAGASKTMKTSVGVDLALSLARPCRFLGQFWVPEPQKVLFLSAESGEATIQETARRIARSKGFELSQDESVTWGFWVPRAKNGEQLLILDHQLDESQATVAVIDPLYQVLNGEDQANLSMNGEQLQAICTRCLKRGVTPILVDHVKRSSSNAQNHLPLELTDVSGAGKAEFFRQWLLISRREKFNPETHEHKLWMSVGGSAGHCGLWAVDIDESRDEATESRTWAVSVERGSEAVQNDAEMRAARRAAQREADQKEKLERNVQRIRDTFKSPSEKWTARKIRDHAGLSGSTVGPAIAKLMQFQELEETTTKTTTGTYTAYRWTRLAEVSQ